MWAPSLDPIDGGIQAYSLEVANGLTALGYRVQPVLRTRSVLRFSAEACLLPATRRPDLIFSAHLHFSPLCHLLHRTLGIPYVVTLHGIEAWKKFSRRHCEALAEADRVLPVSEFTLTRARECLAPTTANFSLLYNTFDDERFSIGAKNPALLARHGLAMEDRVILTVGRLLASDAYKGQDRVIECLPAILERVPGAKFLIVGDGTDRARLEKLVHDTGVADSVVFAGRVPMEELADYYRLGDVFAMPSKGEGFGIVYLEALACGVPVIGGAGDGARDALKGGLLGLLVNPDNLTDVGSAIVRCLERDPSIPFGGDPALLRQAALDQYGRAAFRAQLGSLVESVLASSNR